MTFIRPRDAFVFFARRFCAADIECKGEIASHGDKGTTERDGEGKVMKELHLFI